MGTLGVRDWIAMYVIIRNIYLVPIPGSRHTAPKTRGCSGTVSASCMLMTGLVTEEEAGHQEDRGMIWDWNCNPHPDIRHLGRSEGVETVNY